MQITRRVNCVLSLSSLLAVAVSAAPPALPEPQEPAGMVAEGVDRLPEVGRLPAATCDYLYRMDWTTLRSRLAGSQALAVIENPEVQRFLKSIGSLGEGEGQAAAAFAFALDALHREVVMGAVPLSADEAEEGGDSQETRRRSAFMLVTPKKVDRDALAAHHDAVMKVYAEFANAQWKDVEIGPVRLKSMGEPLQHAFTGWYDDRLVWATDRAAAEAAVAGGADEALGDSPLFRATVGPLFGERDDMPIALYYHDLTTAWEALAANDPTAIRNRLSWASVDAMAGATFIDGNGYRNRHYWKIAPGERSGLFKYSRDARIDEHWLRRVPADAQGVVAGVWDLSSFFSTAMIVGARMASGSSLAEAAAMSGQASMMLQPISQFVGPRYLWYAVPGRYGDFPFANVLPTSDRVLVTELRDRAGFLTALKQVANMTPTGGIEENDFNGTKVLVWNLAYASIYVALVADNVALVTTNPQLIKDAVDQWTNPGRSIIDTDAYVRASRYLQPEACFMAYFPPGGFSRCVLDRDLPMLQQTLKVFRMMVLEFDDDKKDRELPSVRPFLLPRGSAIARHVTEPTVISAVDDGDGVLFDGYAPVLCTPYYWSYVYAVDNFLPRPGPVSGVLTVTGMLLGVPVFD